MSRQLTLIIHALHTGGAERVLARMANHWAQAGADVTVITLSSVASDTLSLHPRVGRIGLDLMRPARNAWHGLFSNLQRVWRLRKAIRRAGATQVVSFTDTMNIVTLLACWRLDVGVVIAERSNPARQRLSPGWERLRRLTYPRCRTLVVQTEAVARFCRSLVKGRPVAVIPNPALPPDGTSAATEPASWGGTPRRVVGLGRLSREKGFDLLVRAFSQVASRHADWTLQIVGDGPERPALAELIAQLGLGDRVHLRGWTDQPASLLQQADLFVVASRYEGFPNALLEAMACGLPVISFACDSGPSEIIRHDVDGLLVPPDDVEALAGAMERLMSDAGERAGLGQRAREVITRFDEATFYQRWEQILARSGSQAEVHHEEHDEKS